MARVVYHASTPSALDLGLQLLPEYPPAYRLPCPVWTLCLGAAVVTVALFSFYIMHDASRAWKPASLAWLGLLTVLIAGSGSVFALSLMLSFGAVV